MAFDVRGAFALPDDGGLLVGRVWRPDVAGPAVVAVRGGKLVDITRAAATTSQLCNSTELAQIARDAEGETIGGIDEILAATPRAARRADRPYLLSPIDLQAIK